MRFNRIWFCYTPLDSATALKPVDSRARILILGVGNVPFGNDGFGPEAIDYLAHHIPDSVYAIDVGTGARKVLFTVSLSETRPQEIVIVESVDGDKTPAVYWRFRSSHCPSLK